VRLRCCAANNSPIRRKSTTTSPCENIAVHFVEIASSLRSSQ
jgi:hypothetical protein